jgi:hypothetical protein
MRFAQSADNKPAIVWDNGHITVYPNELARFNAFMKHKAKQEAPTQRIQRPEEAETARMTRVVAEGLGETIDHSPSDNG